MMATIRPLDRVAHPRVLVVGGGIAGIQAALEVAAVGLPVTLVEAGFSIGGRMAQLDKTFPTNDCAMCILSPRMLEISRHPLITIQTSTQAIEVRGRAGDFQVLLSRRPRFVDVGKCTGCGECVRVCPQSLPDPYNLGLSQTKAIHVPFPQAIPQAAYLTPEACRIFRGKSCEACIKVCPAGAINLKDAAVEWTESVGAIILALGATPAPADEFPGYGHPDVVTSVQFERLLSATGPHGGKLVRPSDHTEPARLAFIQCVGSRDPQAGAAYCSTVCCMTSLKEALVAREISARRVESTIFYMDLRAQGKGYEGYLEQARGHGVGLVRSRVTAVAPQPQGGVLVRFTDAHGRPREEPFDLAVLSVGLRPGGALPALARRLGVGLNEHGFIQTSPLLQVTTARTGVLVCGAAREPMDIPESVTTASAAAAVASRLYDHRQPHLGPQDEAGFQPGGGISSPDRGLSLSLRHQYRQDHRPGETIDGRGPVARGRLTLQTTCFPARWIPPPGCGRPSRPKGSTGWWWPPAVPGPTKGSSGRSWPPPA